jgi:hypothetical protein
MTVAECIGLHGGPTVMPDLGRYWQCPDGPIITDSPILRPPRQTRKL